ncbi:hypothetical protein ACFLVZ_00630 [Chloroflexota bacterium]
MNEFKNIANRYVESIRYEKVVEISEVEIAQTTIYRIISKITPPPRLSFIAGDCIHNLRSILDNMVFRIGFVAKCSQAILDGIHFPVCKEPEHFPSEKGKLKGIPIPAIDLIESFQQYNPYKGQTDSSHPLRILHDMWNIDKHRSPAIILSYQAGTAIQSKKPHLAINYERGRIKTSDVGFITLHSGIIGTNKEFIFATHPLGETKDFRIEPLFNICFDQEGPAGREPAPWLLSEMHLFVNHVLPLFKPFLR